MTKRRFISGFVAAACLQWVVMAPTTVQAKDKWISLKSPHFYAVSNAGQGRTKKLIGEMEEFRQLLVELFNLRNLERVPVRVYIFKNDRSLMPFKPLRAGQPANVTGYFQPGTEVNVIALNAKTKGNPLHIVRHEYVHLITSYTQGQLPLWLSEGMAEFYSTFDTVSGHATIGKPIGHHLRVLRGRGLYPLEEFFKLTHGSSEYNEKKKQGVFYAQSWLLVHYLMLGEKGKYQPRFLELLKLMEAKTDFRQALLQVFGSSAFSDLRKALNRYARQDRFYVTNYKIEDVKAIRDFTIARLQESEVQVHLGDLLRRTNRGDEAAEFYHRAKEMDPGSPRADEGLGLLAVRRQDEEKAFKHLSAAIERGSEAYLVHRHWAEIQMGRAGVTGIGDVVQVPESDLERIEASLRKAAKLAPGSDRCQYLLATLSLRTGRNPASGRRAIRKAIELKPREPFYRMTESALQIAAKNFKAAERSLKGLAASDDFQARRYAEAQLEYLDYLRRANSASRASTSPAPDRQGGDSESPKPRVSILRSEELPRDPTFQGSWPKRTCEPSFVNIKRRAPVPGRLLRVDCKTNPPQFVVLISGREERLVAHDPAEPILFSCELKLETFECGPFEYRANIYFVPGMERDPETGAFKVLAIEFKN